MAAKVDDAPAPVLLITPADLRGTISALVRKAVMTGRAEWMPGHEGEGDMRELLAARDKAAGFRWSDVPPSERRL